MSTASHGIGDPPLRRALGELGLVTGGKLVSLSSLLLGNLLVARWTADPGEYGRYAAGLTLALILDAALGFPLDLSTIRFAALHPAEPQRVDQLQAAAFRVKWLLGGVLFAVAMLWGEPMARALLGGGGGRGLAAIVALCTVGLLLARSTAVRLQVHAQFGRYAAFDAFQGASRLAALAVPIVLGHRSAEAFLAAHLAGTAVSFAAGFRLLPRDYLRAPWPARRDVREAAVHAAFTAGIVFFGTFTGRADVPAVAASASIGDAGHYAVALQVATLLSMLASYYSVVMQPRVIQMARAGRLGTLLRWNITWATMLSGLAATTAIWVLPILLPAVFGARYAPATPIAQVLLIGTCADLFFMPVSMVFAIQLVPAWSLAGEGLIAVAFLGAVVGGAARSLVAMAWLVTGIRLAKLTLYSAIVLRHLNQSRPTTAA